MLVLAIAPAALAQSAAAPPDVLGRAAWEYSLDGGKTFAPRPPMLPPATKVHVLARATFTPRGPDWFADARDYAALELHTGLAHSWPAIFRLNDRPIRPPLEGMIYRVIPAIDPHMLRDGPNVLAAEITAINGHSRPVSLEFAPRLTGRDATDLQIRTGPILGAFGKDWLTVTARTNLPAKARVTVVTFGGRKAEAASQTASALHRLRVSGLGDPWKQYTLRVETDQAFRTVGASRRRPPDKPDAIRFAVVGDSRTDPNAWSAVAAAIRAAGPELVIHTGDAVSRGINDWEWDEEFFTPAGTLFAEAPVLLAWGNHEENSPLGAELLYSPSPDGRGRNWSQAAGPVRLIAVDGAADFSAGSDNARWLEKELAAAEEPFVFVFDHYPAWTSGMHGATDAEGRPAEAGVRHARQVILPLLEKYRAAALVSGHDHFYERSELPGGVVQIITAGGGAPLRRKVSEAVRRNPHSTTFASVLHFCVFEVTPEECRMRVLAVDGKEIDQRTWRPRK